jgi:hypothetical protein
MMAGDSESEAREMLALHGGGREALARSLDLLSRQFLVIQSRSQLLLTLATITLTITGFSGPRMAESGPGARLGLVLGLVFVLAAVTLLLANLRIRWLTQFLGEDPQRSLVAVLRYRNAKTRWYLAQIILLVIGLGCYVGAIIAYVASIHRA